MKPKIPYFRQEKNTSCGIACVRMVAAFYGKNTNIKNSHLRGQEYGNL
jgi:ABC-type bacteriocin/lantibiotic exporter with double-glycine peptidase domain